MSKRNTVEETGEIAEANGVPAKQRAKQDPEFLVIRRVMRAINSLPEQGQRRRVCEYVASKLTDNQG